MHEDSNIQGLLSKIDEARLIQGIRAGDERALRELMEVSAAYLVGVARMVLNDPQDAEEVVQDVLFELWSKSNSLEIRSGLIPYLSVSVRNRAVSRRRGRASAAELSNELLDEVEWNTLPSDDASQDKILEEAESILEFMRRTESLPRKQSEVIAYRLSGFSIAEIAQKMGISSKGVEINITRAYTALRKMFSGE